MLKITTAIFATLFVLQTSAQIKKGAILLGGQIAASSNKSSSFIQFTPTSYTQNNTQKASVFGLNIGTAIKENKVLGLSFSTSSNKETRENSPNNIYTEKINQNEIGLFYRQYKKIHKDFFFFGQADIATVFGKGSSISNPGSNTRNVKQTGSKVSVSTGIGYAVLKKLQIEITLPNLLGLQSISTKQTDGPPNSGTRDDKNFSFYSSLSNNNALGNLRVGFRLIF